MRAASTPWPPWGLGGSWLFCTLFLLGMLLQGLLRGPGAGLGDPWEVALWQCCVPFSMDLCSKTMGRASFLTMFLGTWSPQVHLGFDFCLHLPRESLW